MLRLSANLTIASPQRNSRILTSAVASTTTTTTSTLIISPQRHQSSSSSSSSLNEHQNQQEAAAEQQSQDVVSNQQEQETSTTTPSPSASRRRRIRNNNNNNKQHFTSSALWNLASSSSSSSSSPPIQRAYSSMCYDASRIVLPSRGTRSPTTQAHHAAVSPPLLRMMQTAEGGSTGLADEARVKDLAAREIARLKILMEIAEQEEEGGGENVFDAADSNIQTQEQQQQFLNQQQEHSFSVLSAPSSSSSSSSSSSFSTNLTAASGGGGSKGNDNKDNSPSSSSSSTSSRPMFSSRPSTATSSSAGSGVFSSSSSASVSTSRLSPAAARRERNQQQQQQQQQTRTTTRSLSPPSASGAHAAQVHRQATQQPQRGLKVIQPSKQRKIMKTSSAAAAQNEATATISSSSSSTSMEKKKKEGNGSSSSLFGSSSQDNFSVRFRTWDESIFEDAIRDNKLLFIRVFDSLPSSSSSTDNSSTNATQEETQQQEEEEKEGQEKEREQQQHQPVLRVSKEQTFNLLQESFIPVAVDWSSDAEVCEAYHSFLQDRVQLSNGQENLRVRNSELLSTPETPTEFDVVVLSDGTPVWASGRHLQAESESVLKNFGDFTFPLMGLDLALRSLARSWSGRTGGRDPENNKKYPNQKGAGNSKSSSSSSSVSTSTTGEAHVRAKAREYQEEHTRIRGVPRSTMGVNHIKSCAEQAIEDFNFLLNGEQDKESSNFSWAHLTAKPGLFVQGMVPLLVDAQNAFRASSSSSSNSNEKSTTTTATSISSAGTEYYTSPYSKVSSSSSSEAGATAAAEEQRKMKQQIIDDAFKRMVSICKEGEEGNLLQSSASFDELAEGAWIEVLLRQESSCSSSSSSSSAEAKELSNKWIQVLRQRLLECSLKSNNNNSNNKGISRSEASSGTLVKIVKALCAHVAASLPTSTTSSSSSSSSTQTLELSSESKSSLRLAIWVTTLLFQRSRGAVASGSSSSSSSSQHRLAAIDAVHGHTALVGHLLRLVAYDEDLCGDLLSTCSDNLVESLRPLHRAWVARSKLTSDREKASRSLRLRILKRNQKFSEQNTSPFAARFEQVKKEAAESLRLLKEQQEGNESGEVKLTSAQKNAIVNRATSSWFSLAPLLDEEVDLDDAMTMMSSKNPSSSNENNNNNNNVQDNNSSSPEENWMSTVLTRAMALPIHLRQQLQVESASNNNNSKNKKQRKNNTNKSPQKQQQDQKTAGEHEGDEQLWKAANLVWAGAPRIDRGEVLSNALRTLDLLHHTTNTTTSSSHSANPSKEFVNLYFSLRQLSSMMLTSNSRKKGDCLACHGQLLGTALVVSSSPTFALSSSSSSNSSSQQNEKFSALDFGAITHRRVSPGAVDIDATLEKFCSFLTSPRAVSSTNKAVSEATTLSLFSNVIPISSSSSCSSSNEEKHQNEEEQENEAEEIVLVRDRKVIGKSNHKRGIYDVMLTKEQN